MNKLFNYIMEMNQDGTGPEGKLKNCKPKNDCCNEKDNCIEGKCKVCGEACNDIDEIAPVKVKRDKQERKKAKIQYKKNKASIKRTQKLYRKSSIGRQTAKKTKIKNKSGKTSTGKRQSKYF